MMRERLIKELDGADLFLRNRAKAKPDPLTEYDIEVFEDIAKICDEAARMLERAIVPPCKVGDTVFIVDGTADEVVEGEVVTLEYNRYTEPMEWITVEGIYPFFGRLTTKDKAAELLGKTVFLTREEAEQALKEREEH